MRAKHATQEVMCSTNIGHPVAHRLVDRVLQRPGAGIDATDFRAQQSHAEDVQLLAPHVFCSHVDDTFKAKQRTDRGRSYAMLSGASLGDNAMLAHPFDQQHLPQAVIDFVSASVQEIFTLQINLCAPEFSRQATSEEHRRGTPSVSAQQIVQTLLKTAVPFCLRVVLLQFFQSGHQRFGDIAATIGSETAATRPCRRVLYLWNYCACHLCDLLCASDRRDKSTDLLRIFLSRPRLHA